jgi:hypothetical protein
MIEPKFSRWVLWKNRHIQAGIKNPGVYALALSSFDLSNEDFDWAKDIIYFGMTNSRGGLKARLKQFDDTISGKEGHGGAERVRYEYRNYDDLIEKLYVSVSPVACNTKESKPDDFLKMGEVAYMEYYCFSQYHRLYGRLPQFNNKKSSPKLKAKELKAANDLMQPIANKAGSG